MTLILPGSFKQPDLTFIFVLWFYGQMTITFAFALSPVWTWWLGRHNMICKQVRMTKEHVIPKSLLPHKIIDQKRNIIGMPELLNHKRGTLKYVDSDEEGIPVWPCRQCDNPLCPLMGKIVSDGFSPPALYKPVIGASVLRSMYDNLEIVDAVHDKVLDVGTAIHWVSEGYEELPGSIKSIFHLP